MAAINESIELMSNKRLNRTIKRMSYQLLELSQGMDTVLIGLNSRGYHLASMIKSVIDEIDTVNDPCRHWQYNVDNEPGSSAELLKKLNGNNFTTFLVDDVIFSGKTMFNALKNLNGLEKRSTIYTAVLVDRGHRKVPVHASVTGIEVPTKLNERVILEFTNEKPGKVILINN
ncbi:MAG: phosphoribosyltransferase family protein [Balneolaceae bacterium]